MYVFMFLLILLGAIFYFGIEIVYKKGSQKPGGGGGGKFFFFFFFGPGESLNQSLLPLTCSP